ncbi:MAG: hypothetical protein HC769_25165 [Cyanobacteria bacterium CRU_2_1]|nr:hypothetical protein [Cyanobacteria bacterium CRU_2_1]
MFVASDTDLDLRISFLLRPPRPPLDPWAKPVARCCFDRHGVGVVSAEEEAALSTPVPLEC